MASRLDPGLVFEGDARQAMEFYEELRGCREKLWAGGTVTVHVRLVTADRYQV
ncbi:hypothetical protein [Streptomyces sp. NPDC047706]|uniref:hypothetical protein n=1 Tax=Streptomyces sp. NPDC047706 TaxID=3365486 RepID=UPI00371E7E80